LTNKKRAVGVESFEDLTDKASVEAFFKLHFADFARMVPDYVEQFFGHPTGHMVTVKCGPWSYGDSVVLMGDAAHAIVPFFGQGMNAGFEDVVAFDRLLDEKNSWSEVFETFFHARKGNSDAIADMAVENFTEMSAKTADPRFLYQKKIEKQLMDRFPGEYKSRYSMVSFSLTPYQLAYEAGVVQNGILDEITRDNYPDTNIDFDKAHVLIRARLRPVMDKINSLK
jgi:kynurenine 3-monooxygenase